MTALMREKHNQVYIELKSAAFLAIAGNMDAYDFRQLCSLAIAQAAMELEKGNCCAAARRLGIHRNTMGYRAKLVDAHKKNGIASESIVVDNSPQ